MKIFYSDSWVTIYLVACPACDLPLAFAQSTRTDDPSAWLRGEDTCDECPRCGEPLPDELDLEPVAA